ncbi:MAG: 4-hydroxythreonine-4-phosphate dehydrogenase PdxA [Betaproteobacteria bacterium]|nr:4-hydroxythreonine-4-phosphate dehydrogenase PdxA [Betaproteobacteria bacterium]NCA15998.1 4-hydroxythreonine-4-phosphate dehydrogenase PdxA [Betaproteobacteria bacterium]
MSASIGPRPSRPHSIALTAGDPAGVGPEITLKALHAQPQLRPFTRVFADAKHLYQEAHRLAIPVDDLIVEDVGGPGHYTPGLPSREAGETAYRAIAAAATFCATQAASLVTAPVSKSALALAGHAWPGHTELLAHLSNPTSPPDVRMMLATPSLRVVLHSTHLALSEAIAAISAESLLRTIRIANTSCPGLKRPRVAVAALNPHASEGGLFGHEEAEIITPAINTAQLEGIDASGPWPADTIFMQASGETQQSRRFDVVVCQYHDQGLIPIKLHGVDEGVNVTLGLPFFRSSVDHGTAFDIAGRGVASSRSLEHALLLAFAQAQ